MSLKQYLQRDDYPTGLVLGILIPILAACFIIPAGRLALYSSQNLTFYDSALFLLCLIPNLLVMRYYIVRARLEKTGKGVLILTVLEMALFFIFVHGHPFNLPI